MDMELANKNSVKECLNDPDVCVCYFHLCGVTNKTIVDIGLKKLVFSNAQKKMLRFQNSNGFYSNSYLKARRFPSMLSFIKQIENIVFLLYTISLQHDQELVSFTMNISFAGHCFF